MDVDLDASSGTVPQELIEGAVDISPAGDGGVLKVILREGTANDKPGVGDEVNVHYVGTLTSGEKFDSSRDRGDKLKFKLGEGQVIKAWDIGVATMNRGELARLICRSEYAYGVSGSPPKIPGGATLIFEVELYDWKGDDLSENKDGGIMRSIVKKGDGYQSPNDGALVEVHLKGLYQGHTFEDRDVKFVVGEGSEQEVVEGIDTAIKKFKKGEVSLLSLSPQYAFGTKGCDKLGIPGDAPIKFEVTLKSMEKAKEAYEMEADEKLEQSELSKSKGTNYFKSGSYPTAIKKYKRAISLLDDDTDFKDEHADKRKALLLASHLNCAMCHLKLEQWTDARSQCDSAIKYDSMNEKAYFRRAQAYMGTKDWEQAKYDFRKVLDLEPDNQAARKHLAIADVHIKQEKQREKKLYGGMFEKLAERDSKKKPIPTEKTNEKEN